MADTIHEEPNMEEFEQQRVAKEHLALTDASLSILGAKLDAKTRYNFAMRLCIPTCVIAQMKASTENNGQTDDYLGPQFLLDWKRRNAGAKDKVKLALLEKALRDIAKEEWADAVRDCGNMEQELTPDMFRQ